VQLRIAGEIALADVLRIECGESRFRWCGHFAFSVRPGIGTAPAAQNLRSIAVGRVFPGSIG
jgi:hypothetical protein